MHRSLTAALVALIACQADDDTPFQDDDGITIVDAAIEEDTVWTADRTWVLDDIIYVTKGARLRIEPGTRIEGRQGSALIATRDGFLEASGRPDAPIVFTSNLPEGERYRGSWGGVAVLGSAPVNHEAKLEGINEDDARAYYGGTDTTSSCGKIEYVRIEFAGYEALLNNELNGLTLAGCGTDTIVRNVQTHRTLDDGIEVFGGTVNLSHLVITDPGDDGLDWDAGWTGSAQFVIVHMGLDAGDNAIEADNLKVDELAEPYSRPRLYNFTLLGSRDTNRAHRGVLFRRGTGGLFANFLATGFSLELFDIVGDVAVDRAETGELWVSHGVTWNLGLDGVTVNDDIEDDDGGFDEAAWLAASDKVNAVGEYGGLPGTGDGEQIVPDYIPSTAAVDGRDFYLVEDADHLDQSARFLGAVAPWDDRPFYDGWTDFPVD
jgi:hypothetical protein